LLSKINQKIKYNINKKIRLFIDDATYFSIDSKIIKVQILTLSNIFGLKKFPSE
jgi:hypothetical protein